MIFHTNENAWRNYKEMECIPFLVSCAKPWYLTLVNFSLYLADIGFVLFFKLEPLLAWGREMEKRELKTDQIRRRVVDNRTKPYPFRRKHQPFGGSFKKLIGPRS